MEVKLLSRVRLLVTPRTAAHKDPVRGIFRARALEWVPLPSPPLITREMHINHNEISPHTRQNGRCQEQHTKAQTSENKCWQNVEKRDPRALLVGMLNGTATADNFCGVSTEN